MAPLTGVLKKILLTFSQITISHKNSFPSKIPHNPFTNIGIRKHQTVHEKYLDVVLDDRSEVRPPEKKQVNDLQYQMRPLINHETENETIFWPTDSNKLLKSQDLQEESSCRSN